MSIQFLQPTFNEFTLNFPEPTEAEKQKAVEDATHEVAVNAMVELLTLGRTRDRRARQTRKRLEALCAGGWIIEFEPRQHLGLQTSTRPERRRAQLGRK
jgi:hypothetical protein